MRSCQHGDRKPLQGACIHIPSVSVTALKWLRQWLRHQVFAEATKDVEWLSANGMHLLDLSALAHMFDLSALQATVMPLIWDCYASTDRNPREATDPLQGARRHPARLSSAQASCSASAPSPCTTAITTPCFRFTHALDFAPPAARPSSRI